MANKYNKDKIPYKSRGEKAEEIRAIKRELEEYALSSWGKKWVKAILHYGRPYRMRRALNYAKEERISNLLIAKGKIFAMVQGTAPTPYRVSILFDTIDEQTWEKILQKIASKAKYIVNLYENRIPEDIEEIFAHYNSSLFPPPTRNLNASCSCPDKAIPCKHIAATILYIARVVDFNPFILFTLKGKTREEIIERIRTIRNEHTALLIHDRTQGQKAINRKEVELIDISAETDIDLRENKISERKSKSFNVPSMPTHELDLSENGFESIDLRGMDIAIAPPETHIEIIETLGFPPNTERPDLFGLIFGEIYRKVSNKVQKLKKELEKTQI